jgi:hypothetical protein
MILVQATITNVRAIYFVVAFVCILILFIFVCKIVGGEFIAQLVQN